MNVTKTTTTPCVGGTQTPKPPGNSSDFAKVMAEQAAGKEVALEPKPEPNYPICETKRRMATFHGPNYTTSMPMFENTEGLEGDELFAAIVKHYSGRPEFFSVMVDQLYDAGLITAKESNELVHADWTRFSMARIHQEGLQGKEFDLDAFIKNYYLSLSRGDWLSDLMDSLKSQPETQQIMSKISNIISEQNMNYGGNINE
ncbi:MAG: hypothetical protein FWH04_09695 [Oscillospiraceae bacterium]|nr:hypothetical protein [Oscillospiraceae bacterium]